MAEHQVVQLSSRRGRGVLLALITASGTAFLDSSVVTVALPAMQRDLGGGLAAMQWIVDAYLLTLGAFLLLGGSLGDLLGRRRVFVVGLVAFAAASVLCAVAPSAPLLVAARAVQGVAAALLVPGSLAIISEAFAPVERARAIGWWGGLSGLFTMLGPFVGGLLVDLDESGWRWVFLLNLPILAVSYLCTMRVVPALPGSRAPGPLGDQLDVVGGLLAVAGLGLLAGGLIESAALGATVAAAVCLLGLALLAGFVMWERRCERQAREGGRRVPMMPPSMWRLRTFSVANLVTLLVYGPIGGMTLILTLHLILTLGWSALAAGAAGVPITVVLAVFSGRVGALVPRVGARPLLVAGPVLMALGQVLLADIDVGDDYLSAVLPGILTFAAGLVLVVAPVTSTALGAVPAERAGTASGVNNTTARVAQLVAVAALPLAAGITSASLDAGADSGFADGYPRAMLISAGICLAGGLAALLLPRGTGRTNAAVPPAQPTAHP
jgi:EmrB/QacA subfamily drug resistance transporter